MSILSNWVIRITSNYSDDCEPSVLELSVKSDNYCLVHEYAEMVAGRIGDNCEVDIEEGK